MQDDATIELVTAISLQFNPVDLGKFSDNLSSLLLMLRFLHLLIHALKIFFIVRLLEIIQYKFTDIC